MEQAVKIRFETTIDDVIKFNRFYIENSPTLRRQRMIFSLIVPAILLILAILIMFVNVDAIIEDMFRFFVQATALGILGLVFSIGWYFFSRWQWMNNIERNLRKLYAEGDNRAVLGWREI